MGMGMGMVIPKGIDMGMKCTKSSPSIVGRRHYLGYNKVNGPKMDIPIFALDPLLLSYQTSNWHEMMSTTTNYHD